MKAEDFAKSKETRTKIAKKKALGKSVSIRDLNKEEQEAFYKQKAKEGIRRLKATITKGEKEMKEKIEKYPRILRKEIEKFGKEIEKLRPIAENPTLRNSKVAQRRMEEAQRRMETLKERLERWEKQDFTKSWRIVESMKKELEKAENMLRN